jgi:hypothetical protein
LPYQISTISLDGDASTLNLGRGPTQIGRVYSTKSDAAPDTDYDIQVTGPGHYIGALVGNFDADSAILVQTGGELTLGHTDAFALSPARRFAQVQSGGLLRFDSLDIRRHGGAGATRTVPFAEQATGGILQIQNLIVDPDVSATTAPLIVFNSDVVGNILNARGVSANYTFTLPANAVSGYYETRQGLPNSVPRGPYPQSIANNAVMSLNFGGDRTTSMFRVVTGGGAYGQWRARAAVTPAITAMATISGIVATTGVLTGTTGTPGNITVSVAAGGLYYVENRSGAAIEVIVEVVA